MNNSDTGLIVISFNEGHQSLLERHVPLGWCGGWGKWSGGNEASLKEEIFFETQK